MSATPAVRLDRLTKRYGAHRALDQLSLTIERGEILALLGHNGAGKTTLMKLTLGLTRPSEGNAVVLGLDMAGRQMVEAKRQIGFLSENVTLYPNMSGRETLRFFARLKGARPDTCDALLERVGLPQVARQAVKGYSKGMRQRLGLAIALIGQPKLLLMDEPTSGLDPGSRQSFFEILRERAAEGATVVISSHVLTEIEAKTNRVAILKHGRLVACGSLAALREQARLPVLIRVSVPPSTTSQFTERLGAQVQHVNGRTFELACDQTDKIALLRRIIALDLPITDIDVQLPSLDRLYAHYRGPEDAL
jgi:Cu-processing system ATP-binding protein